MQIDVTGSRAGGVTYLLIGSDARSGLSASDRAHFGTSAEVPGERADAVLVLRVDHNGTRLLSVPRDLLVLSPAGSLTRLTLTFLTGPQATVDTLCRSLGIGVDHVVVLHFTGLRSLVDAVGGIDVETPALRDRVVGLTIAKGGRNHLTGEQALEFVRARSIERLTSRGWSPDLRSSDARADRARKVLDALASRIQLSVFHPFRSASFIQKAARAVTVERGMGIGAFTQLARALHRSRNALGFDLPTDLTHGAVPIARLRPNAASVLTQFDGGPTANCPGALLARSSTDVRRQASG